jgi:hypothetical protein
MKKDEIYNALARSINTDDIKLLMKELVVRAIEGDNTAVKIYMQTLRDLMEYSDASPVSELEMIKQKLSQRAEQLRLFKNGDSTDRKNN